MSDTDGRTVPLWAIGAAILYVAASANAIVSGTVESIPHMLLGGLIVTAMIVVAYLAVKKMVLGSVRLVRRRRAAD